MKKALSILLAALLLFTAALPAFAEEGGRTVTFRGPSAGLITTNPAGEDIGTPYYFVKTENGRACFVEDPEGKYYLANDGYYHTADELTNIPENAKTFGEIGDVKIDQVVIGSCTNGRLEDLIAAAEIMKGRNAAKNVRVIVIPATQQVHLDAMEMGLLRTFIEFGAVVSTPTCGPCLGGYMGILAAGERAITTTNRNFVGRMGHTGSEVILASPAVAAASAVKGALASPEDLG